MATAADIARGMEAQAAERRRQAGVRYFELLALPDLGEAHGADLAECMQALGRSSGDVAEDTDLVRKIISFREIAASKEEAEAASQNGCNKFRAAELAYGEALAELQRTWNARLDAARREWHDGIIAAENAGKARGRIVALEAQFEAIVRGVSADVIHEEQRTALQAKSRRETPQSQPQAKSPATIRDSEIGRLGSAFRGGVQER